MVVRYEPNNDRRAFLRFPLNVKQEVNSNKLVKAKVIMYSTFTLAGVPSINWTLHPVESNKWEESTILWRNKPNYGSAISSVKGLPAKDVRNKPFDKERVVSFDITKSFEKLNDVLPEEMSFMVYQNKRANKAQGWSSFYAKESEIEIARPIIVLSIEDKRQVEILNEVKDLIAFENHVGSYTSEQLAEVKKHYNNGEPTDFEALASAYDALKKNSPLHLEGDRVYTFFTREWPEYAVTVASDKKAYNYKYDAEKPANSQWLLCTVEGANYLYNIGMKNFFVMGSDQWYVGSEKSNFGFDTATENDPFWYCAGPYGKMGNKPNDLHFMHSKSENGIITGWRGSITKSQYKIMDVTEEVEGLAEIIKAVKSELMKDAKVKALAQIEAAHNIYKVDPTSHYMGYGKTDDTEAYSKAQESINAASDEAQLNETIKTYMQFIADNTILPQENKYYAIESAFAFNDKKTKAIYESYEGEKNYAMWKDIDSCGVDFLWKMTPDAKGRYVISSINTGKCLTGVKFGHAIYTEDSTAIKDNYAYSLYPSNKTAQFELRNYYSSNDYATVTAYNDADKTANANDTEGNALKSWKSSSAPIYWMIREVEEITVAMDSLDYVSRNFPFAADFTAAKEAGAKVYYVTQQMSEYAILEEVMGNVIAANTPVIIAGEKNKEFTIAIATEGDAIAQNLLKGINASRKVEGNVYALGNDENVTAFLKFDTTNKMSKNTAYLVGDAANSNKVITLSIGIPDGIEGVESDTEADHTWFTLGGVRVNKPTKGIFVNGNGKVVLFK